MDFFGKLLELRSGAPRMALPNLVNQNSPYCVYTDSCKNCYRLSNAFKAEDCYYGRTIFNSTNCIDCDHSFDCELCYSCIDCKNCYGSDFLQQCENCNGCEWGYDLKSCTDCFGCVGLRQKSYYIFNKPFSKDEYFARVRELKKKRIYAAEEFKKLQLTVPRLFANILNTENCLGDYVKNSKNCFFCFDTNESQDCLYSSEILQSTDCCDMDIGEFAVGNYDATSAFKLQNSQFCAQCWESSDLEYCEMVFRSHHCFGCVYLNHKSFYILNEPYEKEAYFKKIAEIKDLLRSEKLYGRWFWPEVYPVEDTMTNP